MNCDCGYNQRRSRALYVRSSAAFRLAPKWVRVGTVCVICWTIELFPTHTLPKLPAYR